MAAENRSGQAAGRGSEEGGSSEPRYLAVGKILRPWGVLGMVKVEVLTDFPERFETPRTFYVGEKHRPLKLEYSRKRPPAVLLKFAGYDTPETSAELRGDIIYVPIEEAMKLPEGDYYVHQIVGLEVWTDEGERLGVVRDIWETGANDVYVIDRDGGTVLLPAISQVILNVDLDRRRVTVHLMEGLIS